MTQSFDPSDLIKMFNRQPVPSTHNHIFFCAMPKCATTFIASVLDEIPEIHQCDLVPDYDNREQEIGRIELLLNHHKHYYAVCHVRCSGWTIKLIEDYNLLPVFSYRNIFDVVVSMTDHLRKGDIMPFVFTPSHLAKCEYSEALDFVVDYVVPWLLTFYISWISYPGRILRLEYDFISKSPDLVVKQILAYSGFDIHGEVVENAIAKALQQKARFNKGTTGRGLKMISDAQQQRIRSMASYYQNIDFSLIGL